MNSDLGRITTMANKLTDAIPRDAWTLAQMRELLALVARETL